MLYNSAHRVEAWRVALLAVRGGGGGDDRARRGSERLRGAALVFVVRVFFFFQAEDGIRDVAVTGVQTCALPIFRCLQTLAPPSLRTCDTDDRRAAVVTFFYEPKLPSVASTALRLFQQSFGITSHAPASKHLLRARISFATRWPPRCCVTAPH